MRALTVTPLLANSARLEDIPEPSTADGALLVSTIAVGVCGTDREILNGEYGEAPAGSDRLVIGHESIGRVLEAPAGSGFAAGDLVVGIVRRPDPVPCAFCAVGEWDMCRNGLYTERGIKGRHGYASERFRLEPSFAVKVDPALGALGVLLEPTSIVAKAWDHAFRIGKRSSAWKPQSVLVTGAGPIGLLAALLGHQRGLDVYVFDRVVDGPKPQLVRDLGGHYLGGDISVVRDLAPDVIIECTGVTAVIADTVSRTAPSGVVCLTGVSSGGHTINRDVGDANRRIVLENDAIFGSVNANRSHYGEAAEALARADRSWLARLITRRVHVEDWPSAFEREPLDVKPILAFDTTA